VNGNSSTAVSEVGGDSLDVPPSVVSSCDGVCLGVGCLGDTDRFFIGDVHYVGVQAEELKLNSVGRHDASVQVALASVSRCGLLLGRTFARWAP
jgi:hypothetical protein